MAIALRPPFFIVVICHFGSQNEQAIPMAEPCEVGYPKSPNWWYNTFFKEITHSVLEIGYAELKVPYK